MTPSTMTCEEVLRHLVAYLDREIDAAVAAEIEHHLQLCRACFGRAEFERKLKAELRAAGTRQAPARLLTRLKEIVEKF